MNTSIYYYAYDWDIAGLVKVANREGESNTADDTLYALSVTHQLHCLKHLQLSLFLLGNGGLPSSSDVGHSDHCFAYIRHSIMCAGDLTLESPGTVWSAEQLETIWKGTTHVCKDWGEIAIWQAAHFSPIFL